MLSLQCRYYGAHIPCNTVKLRFHSEFDFVKCDFEIVKSIQKTTMWFTTWLPAKECQTTAHLVAMIRNAILKERVCPEWHSPDQSGIPPMPPYKEA